MFGQTLPEHWEFEVFICDDNSSDGTSEMLSTDFPQVKVIKGNGSLYWGGGMRRAWTFAKESGNFDAYLWLNDDTFILPGGLLSLFEEYISIGEPTVLSAACKVPGKQEFSYGGHHENMRPLPPNGLIQEVTYINGNLVLISKEVEEKVGIISSAYTHYLGDFDYGIRAKAAGFQCYTTSSYLAECESNPPVDWADANLPLSKRWKLAHDVKGRALTEYIAFKRYHHGMLVGFKSWIDIYLRLIFTDHYVRFRDLILKK